MQMEVKLAGMLDRHHAADEIKKLSEDDLLFLYGLQGTQYLIAHEMSMMSPEFNCS